MAKAVAVFLAQVQAHADVIAGVGAEVAVHAAQIPTAGLRFDAGFAARLRRLADAVDDTALAAPSVQHGGRPLQHFDAFNVVQVAHVLAVVADAVQIEIAAGVKAADTHRVKAGVLRAGHVGHARQCVADRRDAVVLHVFDLHGVDGLRHVAGRRLRARGGGDFRHTRVVGVGAFDTDGGQLGGLGQCLRQGG
ncbi:hypothetical protein D3C87_1394640 [compost metagenome]